MQRGLIVLLLAVCSASGCAAIPDVVEEPQIHNPFPQLYRIAILPFFNQSQEPTLKGSRVTEAYYTELQSVPGFEVMPPGVVAVKLAALGITFDRATDFQRVAQLLGVDAVLVGAITDYSPYYPPRMGLAVNWYAANPGFHPIPAGYGLPWGTAAEEYIPDRLVQEAEFALAREQLKTQTPVYPRRPWSPAERPRPSDSGAEALENRPADDDPREGLPDGMPGRRATDSPRANDRLDNAARRGRRRRSLQVQTAAHRRKQTEDRPQADGQAPPGSPAFSGGTADTADQPPPPPVLPDAPASKARGGAAGRADGLPADWPDPRGFIPEAPQSKRPAFLPQSKPVIQHTQLYRGNDEKVTQRLAEYFYFRDEARFGGWQAYLQRSEDFIRFCCHLHIAETLAARGGAGKSRVVWRWHIDRYER